MEPILLTGKEQKRIVELWNNGNNLSEIHRETKISYPTVLKYSRKFGFKKGEKCSYFNFVEPEKKEIIELIKGLETAAKTLKEKLGE